MPSGDGTDGWFDGRGFYLSKVRFIDLDMHDPRLTDEERTQFGTIEEEQLALARFELPISDPRSGLSEEVNTAALALSDLNHAPDDLQAALFTTFDLVDDVQWLKKEFRLDNPSLKLTLCSHPWLGQKLDRQQYCRELFEAFPDVVIHFPGSPELSCSSMQQDLNSSEGDEVDDGNGCSVHAKLFMLEFSDRLRIAVASGNLCYRSWNLQSEVIWVQDFPRLSSNPSTIADALINVDTLLNSGPFARSLGHFLSAVLLDAPEGRRLAWISQLSCFDFRSANAQLILSLPGCFVPARPLHPGQLDLRLPIESSSEESKLLSQLEAGSYLGLQIISSRCWQVVLAGASGDVVVGRLTQSALTAIEAAQGLGFTMVSASGSEASRGDGQQTGTPITVELLTRGANSQQEEEAEHEEQQEDDFYKQKREVSASAGPTFVLFTMERGGNGESLPVVADFTTSTIRLEALTELLAMLEEDYGLYALYRHLSSKAWHSFEEKHFVAMSSSLSWLDRDWFQVLDRYCGGRVPPSGKLPGPKVVVPGGDCSLDPAYLYFLQSSKTPCESAGTSVRLVEHAMPWHSPGRQLVPSHLKLIARLLSDSLDRPYGWIYLGSHNLTVTAWGSVCPLEDGREMLWTGNRELGVLLIEPRRSEVQPVESQRTSSLFSGTPLPFGLPLNPTDLEGRYIRREDSSNGDATEQIDTVGNEVKQDDAGWHSSSWGNSWWSGNWSQAPDGSWTWEASEVPRQEREDPGVSSDEQDSSKEWPYRKSSWWWWSV